MRWAILTVLLTVPSLIVAQGTLTDALSTRPKLKQVLSLKEAVEIALLESPILRGAAAELRAAEERLRQARSEKQPQLSVNAFATTGTIGGTLSSAPTVMPSALVVLPPRSFFVQDAMFMFPLFTGGRLEALIRQAEAVRNSSSFQVEAVKLDVAFEVSVSYLRVLFAQELVKVAEAYVRALEERVRVDREAAKVGRIPEFWVLRSEAELANARQTLANTQRDKEVALIALKTVMGVHPNSEITLTDKLSENGLGTTDLTDREKLLAEAFEKRPELKASLHQTVEQSNAVKAAKALSLPQVSLVAMADYMTGRATSGSGGYMLGLSIGLPILDGGRRKAILNEAKAMLERLLSETEQVKLRIASEIDTALRELQTAIQNVKTAKAALRAAEEDERVAKIRYEVGRSVLVEYLDAIAALVRAQVNYAQALYDLAVAQTKLERATGKLTEPKP
ncbi:MAG: TolC family protein [Candidatus Fervidibacter sp.]|uniref:TolC family protein n=2 Tax=Candidatus Fervidibacter sp. TaxID=3100871 RepID=UPI004049342F